MAYEEMLIGIVIFSYILVILVTFRSRRTVRDLETLVADFRMKDVERIKKAVGSGAPTPIRRGRPDVGEIKRALQIPVQEPSRVQVVREGPKIERIENEIPQVEKKEKNAGVEAVEKMRTKESAEKMKKEVFDEVTSADIDRALLLKSRGKFLETLEEQYQKGIISKETYERLRSEVLGGSGS